MASITTDRRQGLNSGAAIKVPCVAATTANITLSGEQTIDGVAVVTNDRVLVKNQTTASENGIYIADTGTWDYARDWDGSYDVTQGTIVFVNGGTTQSDSAWNVATSGSIVVGTTSVTFEPFGRYLSDQRSDTGALEFTMHEYHENRLPNIKTDFGAAGDGVSDDYAEIQAAISSVTDGEVGVFIVPAGTYLINSALSAGTRKLLWILEGDVTLSGSSPTLPGGTITYGTKQQTVVGQGTFDPFVDQHLDIIPQTSQHHFGLVVGMDATGQTDGKDKCPAYFASKGNGAVDLWGANTLVRLDSGFSGGANSIEVDVNNNSGSDGKGVGVLVNGASANKILAGIILRMNGGAAGGQVGLRIEDDWDDQLMLQGAVTNVTFNQADGGTGNDALLSIDQDPGTASDDAQIRFFRSTAAASCKVTFHNNTATENIVLDASNGRLSGVGRITAMSATAIPAGGTAGAGFLVSSTANLGIFFGSGAPTLSAAQGSLYIRSDGSAIAGLVYVNTNGTTTWAPLTNNTVSADKGDAAATLTVRTSEKTNQWNTPITADRAVTLSTTGAINGDKFRIVRTAAATGAFNLNVGTGPLKALGIGQWCDVEYNGSAWMLTAFGSL